MVGNTAYKCLTIETPQTDTTPVVRGKALIFPVESTICRQVHKDRMLPVEEITSIPWFTQNLRTTIVQYLFICQEFCPTFRIVYNNQSMSFIYPFHDVAHATAPLRRFISADQQIISFRGATFVNRNLHADTT